MLNVAILTGRLTDNPELKTTSNGTSVCRFAIAVSRSFVRSGEERKTDFINVVVWRNTAEFVCKYFKKGSLISVEGSIRVESYQDKDGNNRRTFEIQANNVHFAESKKSDSGVAENDNQPKNYEKEGNSLFDDSDVFETIPTDDDMPF